MIGKETFIIEQKLTVDNSGLITGNKEAKKSTGALDGAVGGVTSKLKGMVTPANLAGAAAAYLSYRTVQAVKDFAAYEKQMSSVNTLLKVSRKELTEYGNGLIDVAIKTGTTKEELASGAYEALSAGVDATDLLSFMETAAKGAAAGMTDVTTATDVLTSTINGFKLESSDATDVMDKLITIQNNGKIVLGEMSTVMGDVADISNSLGVNLDNVGAALSTITMSGTPAAQAGTRIKAMFSELAKEGTDASKVFGKITGQSFKEFITEGGNVGEALQEMEKYAKSNGKQMIDLWSSIESGQGAMGLTGENAEAFTKNLDSMKKSAGELETAYQLASATISTEWTKLTGTMNKKWMELVTKMRDPIIVTLQVIRRGLGGETDDDLRSDATKSLSEAESKIAKLAQQEDELQKQIKENEKNPTWWAEKGWGGTESLKVKLANIQETLKKATWEYEKANNDIAALDIKAKYKTPSTPTTPPDDPKPKGETDEEKAEKKRKLLEKIANYEAEHANKINLIDIQFLRSKSEYQENLNEQLKSGLISREEYNKKLEAFEEENTIKQNTSYKEALEDLKNFYTNAGEIAKANAIEKQILEIEVKITGMEGDLLDGLENPELEAFRQKQLEDLTNFNNEKLIREWEYLEEIGALRLQGEISEQEFTDRKNDFDYNQRELESLFRIEQLEDLRSFYLEQGNMQDEALEVQATINEKKAQVNSAEKKATENKMKWESWAERYKVDVYEQSAEAVMDTYAALASGQIKDLAAFKSYCKEKIAELLLAKGQEHMAEAISWTATGFGYLASLNPVIQSMAPAAFLSAAEHAAAAALFGGASSALSSGSSSSSDDTTESVSSTNDNDIAAAESTASSADDEKVQIYVSTEENAMAKAMVNILEKELNDEYNVSIIGNKK